MIISQKIQRDQNKGIKTRSRKNYEKTHTKKKTILTKRFSQKVCKQKKREQTGEKRQKKHRKRKKEQEKTKGVTSFYKGIQK